MNSSDRVTKMCWPCLRDSDDGHNLFAQVVISHLFGSIHRADHIIKEAKDLGLLVVEDCAQGANTFDLQTRCKLLADPFYHVSTVNR